ncbi:MAG: XRE family transcriptional regulator [Alcaligenaceae bacterium]|nr:MAG: XRE family transcriptional regulator [Alcaligenaceae bacterium]
MDRRFGVGDPARDLAQRDAFYQQVLAGTLTLGQAVAAMRRLSKLTQPEFAAHRGLSVQSLRQIESDKGNPTVATLNKIAAIFGLEVGFVRKSSAQRR